jgi:outer membrane protein
MAMNLRQMGIACLLAVSCFAQNSRPRETFHGLSSPQAVSDALPAPKYLQDRVVDGKLRLSLQDAIVATLLNSSTVRLRELNIESSRFSVLRAHSPFDPALQASFSALRSVTPATSELQGNAVPNSLTQTGQLTYNQVFETGTNVSIGLNSTRFSSNSSNSTLNPSYSSGVSFQITQPLLRNRWLFANRAPLVIARRNLQVSRSTFEAQVNDAILNVVTQYWSVVQTRGNLDVARKSKDAADASFQRDKRALELGALPPLDIYRSESQVASRRVQVIQSEYQLKQAEDALRYTLGANVDPYLHALDLELTGQPAADQQLFEIDTATALKDALDHRPELEAQRQLLANDDISIRLAHNNLLPDLSVTGNYSGNGIAGAPTASAGTPPPPNGGLGDSFNQAFGFGYPTYSVALNLNLPIRNRSAQADLGNALVSRRRDLYSERQLRESITLDVANAVHQLEEAKLSLAASREALDLLKKNLAAEQRKYELGQGTIFFVLEAQTELAAGESTLLQSEVADQLAVTTVQHATGKLLEPYHVQIEDLTK